MITVQERRISPAVAEGQYGQRYSPGIYDESFSLRDLERDVDLDGGDLGRGIYISMEQFENLDFTGYVPYNPLNAEHPCFPIYSSSGSPASRFWRGFYREDNPAKFISFECNEVF